MTAPTHFGIRLGIIFALSGCCVACFQSGRHPQLSSEIPHSVDVVVGGERIGKITNAGRFISLLREGKREPPHACLARGQFVLHYSGGGEIKIAFYPGHSDSDAEFAVGGEAYTIPRRMLMETLKSGGIDINRIPQ